MKEIERYMEKSLNYLSLENSEYEKRCFLRYCYKYKLDVEFGRLLASNVIWCELAKTETVCYLVEKLRTDSYYVLLPTIELLLFELGAVPVIKITTKFDVW